MNLVKIDIGISFLTLLLDKIIATYRRELKWLFIFFHKNNISTPIYFERNLREHCIRLLNSSRVHIERVYR